MEEKKNIILITTDQQRFDTIRALGAREMWTPHLDWLVENGVSYSRAYSDCPVCMPARITLLSGEPAYRHGVLSNKYNPGTLEEGQTLPALLGRQGYQSALFGKHHHGPSTRHLMGFNLQKTIEHYERCLVARGLTHHRRHGVGGNEEVPAEKLTRLEDSLSSWIVSESIEYLITRDPSKPFFTWLSFLKPHPPWDTTAFFSDLYRDAPLPPPHHAPWADRESCAPSWHAVTDELSMTGRLSEHQMRQARRWYAGCVSEIDYSLGVLFGALKELSLLDSTWIVFTSDHGEMLGDFSMGGKCVPFEGSSHIPLVIRPPHSPREHAAEPRRGAVCSDLVTLTDLTETLLHIGGIEREPKDREGALLPIVTKTEKRRERVIGSCMYLHYIVEGRWKYCRESLSNEELLFDLQQDPRELVDRSQDGPITQFRERMDRHLERLDQAARRRLEQGMSPDRGVLQQGQIPPRLVHPGFRSGIVENSGSN